MAQINTIFDVAGRAMSSQLQRLNTVASNLANAHSISSTPDGAYRAIKPVFETQYADELKNSGLATVDMVGIERSKADPIEVYQPDHPAANENGYIYRSAVDPEEEMVEMLEASRQYQNNIEVVSTLRTLMMRTANMGR